MKYLPLFAHSAQAVLSKRLLPYCTVQLLKLNSGNPSCLLPKGDIHSEASFRIHQVLEKMPATFDQSLEEKYASLYYEEKTAYKLHSLDQTFRRLLFISPSNGNFP